MFGSRRCHLDLHACMYIEYVCLPYSSGYWMLSFVLLPSFSSVLKSRHCIFPRFIISSLPHYTHTREENRTRLTWLADSRADLQRLTATSNVSTTEISGAETAHFSSLIPSKSTTSPHIPSPPRPSPPRHFASTSPPPRLDLTENAPLPTPHVPPPDSRLGNNRPPHVLPNPNPRSDAVPEP